MEEWKSGRVEEKRGFRSSILPFLHSSIRGGGEGGERRGLTVRAFAVGAFLSAVIGAGAPYAELVIQGSRVAMTANTPIVFFLFFLWMVVVQVILGVLHRSWAFSRGELITIYVMMIVATAIPTRGFVTMLFSMISGPYYYATPESRWSDLVHPYLPKWMVAPAGQAIETFYQGLPEGSPIPWDVWIRPLFWWTIFALGYSMAVVCAMVILRRRWVEQERLIYPMAQVPIAMLPEEGSRSLLSPLFRRWLLWVGLIVSFGINSIDALHNHYPFLPTTTLSTSVSLFRQSVGLGFRLSPMMLGFSYFIKSDVAIGLWVFYLLRLVEQGILDLIGLRSGEQLSAFSGGQREALIAHQTMGAMIVFVLVGLWGGREHLRRVVRVALGRERDPGEAEEVLSYRGALFGLLGGLAIMALWTWRAGVPLWITPIFFFGAFVIFLALTRAIAEAGLPTVTPRLIPCDFVISGIGVPALGPRGMVAISSSSFVWGTDLLIFLMAPVANGLKLSGEMSGSRRSLLWPIVTAIAVAFFSAVPATLLMAYRHGAVNLDTQYFVGFPQHPFEYAARKIASPSGPDLLGWVMTIAGGGAMGLIMLAQRHFLWWPLHPIGFLVAADWVMNNIWFSVFLAWLVKSLVLRYGGPRLYRTTQPFFIGLVLGQFTAAGFWLIVDEMTGMRGSMIHVY